MKAVGVGSKDILFMADAVIPGFAGLKVSDIENMMQKEKV